MKKRTLAIILIMMLMFTLVLVGCGEKEAETEEKAELQTEKEAETEEKAELQTEKEAETGNEDWKIGILTGTVSQNEEEYRAAEAVLARYGPEKVTIMTYPDKFMDEQETTIANIVSLASDPDIKSIVICQAVPGVSAGINKAKEIRDDILFIAGTPGETPDIISEAADIVLNINQPATGKVIMEQAKSLGAKTFVHYTFPRHMGYKLLSERREILKKTAEEIGIKFVDATSPDPTSDAGQTGTQQFILEDVPKLVAEHGKDTAFFGTNCSMQVPLIQKVLETGAIYPQPCCPSPYHAFPTALNLEIPKDKVGDIEYAIEEIKKGVKEKGMTGRLSTWPRPIAMMYIEAGAEYAIKYAKGEIGKEMDQALIQKLFNDYTKLDVQLDVFVDNETGKEYKNYLLVLLPFLNF